MYARPVSVVPTPICTDRLQPFDQRLARQLSGLLQGCVQLMFAAMGGGNDPRKGIELLFTAFTHLRKEPSLQTLPLVVLAQAPA